ncbi:MAG: DUF309 domain-containing protein [Gemmatimonadetes bacterium]|jgi:uncharacterized protein|nr:DUF309 domain-containing protein [Gemmatimonadota bacterium]
MPQPQPFDASHTRYAPNLPFPPYRHVPGETPHPHTHPQGHSHGRELKYYGLPLASDNWARNGIYLGATDLFNYAYWWEAHEWWEALWRRAELGSPSALFLQGLIQVTAAMIKWNQGNLRGVITLHGHAREKLERVLRREGGETYMGVELPGFLENLDRFLQAFPQSAQEAYGDPSTAPLIRLVGG